MAAACPRLSVCLSVPGSCVQCSGPCSPLAVHPWWEGRATSTSQHGVDVQRCHGALAGARHIPGTVAGKGSLWLCSRLSQRGDVGGGGCLPAPGGLLLLCGNEVMSAPGGNRAGARAAGGSAQGVPPLSFPRPRRRAGHACGLQRDVGCPTGPDSLCSLPAPGPQQ